jgi:hypothetical protein
MAGKSWREVADLLAARLYHSAHCEAHPESKPDLDKCPPCRDRAAYRTWEIKSGRTHRDPPYTGEIVDVLKHARGEVVSQPAAGVFVKEKT